MRRIGIGAAAVLVLALAAGLSSAGSQSGNFSQYPGFAAYFAADPPSRDLPSPGERELLRRHRPHLFIAEGADEPIDFYADYIAAGTLYDGNGAILARSVTQEILNAHKYDPDAVFVYEPSSTPATPTVYGRIDYDTVAFATADGPVAERLTFLTYNVVFRRSGLPAGMPVLAEAFLDLLADPDDWHQLDHYTAATIVLDSAQAPIAVVLQQHNHQQSYLIGRDIVPMSDGRIAVDAAIRSNELYPHSPERRRWPTIAMPDKDSLRFLLSGADPPLTTAEDITVGEVEVDYRLTFLPEDDAFYVFRGYLGEKRLLPGRDGPPGAAFNTLPSLKPLPMQLFVGYWRHDHAGDAERFDATVGAGAGIRAFALAQKAVFYCDWQGQPSGTKAC